MQCAIDAHMSRLATLIGLLLCVATTACLAQGYDAKAGTYEVPLNPLSPTSFAQCDVLRQQWSRLQQSLDVAHQNCLSAHRQEPENPGASMAALNPICSHPACQSLHTARLQAMQDAANRVQACQSQVSAFQTNQQVELTRQQAATIEAGPDNASAAAQLQSDQARQAAAAQMGAVLEQHIDQLRAMKQAEQQNALASADAPSTPELNGDSPFAGTAPGAAGAAVNLNPASSLVRAGDPPDNLGASWQAGSRTSFGDGFYNRDLYVWQFAAPDQQQCPNVTIGDASIARVALFQEIAVEYYQVSGGVITQSNTQKQRIFLQCLDPGEIQGYPKYELFPPPNLLHPGGGGVRG
jgi:hypothetical protein